MARVVSAADAKNVRHIEITPKRTFYGASTPRERNVLRWRRAGWTFQQIGDELGITRQRVHQIADELAMRQGHIDTTFGRTV